jgi:predicted GTPase
MANVPVTSAEEKPDPDFVKIIKEMVGPEEAKHLLEWMSRSGLRIVVAGKTGAGKSSLLNTFLGFDVFSEGDSFDPVTKDVKEYKHMRNGVMITVWDCPGLQDNSGNEDQYLEELKTKTEGDIHLMLYCISMLEPRSDLHWGSAVDRITSILGKDIWKNTALVLTFANMYELRQIDQGLTSKQALKEFNEKVKEWQTKLQERLRNIDGISRSTIDELKVLPAGKYSHQPLFGNKYWLSELWAEMVTRVKAEAQKAVFKLNADRIREPEEVTEEDMTDLHRPLIILTPKVKKILGATAVGGIIATGAGIGASIGAGVGGVIVGIPTLGVGAGLGVGVGAAVGAAVGTGIGAIAAAIVKLYNHRKRNEYEVL